MTENYRHIQALEAELEKYESQAALARAMGVTPGRLSQYLGQKFVGDIDKFNSIIESYYKRQVERAKMVEQEVLHLRITERICDVLDIAQTRKELARIVGPNGIGKTKATQRYIMDHPEAIMVTVNESYRSVKAFLTLLYQSNGRKYEKGTSNDLYETLVKRFKGFDTIIAIDQAHKMSDDAIGMAQAIHDATGVPFAFIGTEDMNPKLNKNGELVSRLTVNRHLQLEPYAEDVNAICKQYMVQDKTVITLMRRKAHQGGLRIVSRILEKARDLSDDGVIDIDAVHASLGITEYNEPVGV